jgi:hypothetical protein
LYDYIYAMSNGSSETLTSISAAATESPESVNAIKPYTTSSIRTYSLMSISAFLSVLLMPVVTTVLYYAWRSKEDNEEDDSVDQKDPAILSEPEYIP